MIDMETEYSKVKILVVDDSDIIRITLSKFLSEYEIEVITCTDGLEGIRKSIEYKPISDYARLIYAESRWNQNAACSENIR